MSFDEIEKTVKNTCLHKKFLTHDDSLKMALAVESGMRVLETKIDDLNIHNEEIRKIIVDDMETINSTHIKMINTVTDVINKSHDESIDRVEKMEEIHKLDSEIDGRQVYISEMLQYCETVIERANNWLQKRLCDTLCQTCEFKKIEI